MAHDPQAHEIHILPPVIKQKALDIALLMPDLERWETDLGPLQNQLRRTRDLPSRRRDQSTSERLLMLTAAVNELRQKIDNLQHARLELINIIQHSEWGMLRFQYFRGFDTSDVDAAAVLAPLLRWVDLPSPVLVANLDNVPDVEFYLVAHQKRIETCAFNFGP